MAYSIMSLAFGVYRLSQPRVKDNGRKSVLTCTCPCGSDKTIGLRGAAQHEQLPNSFAGVVPVSSVEQHFPPPIDHLADRHGDSPDPPRKLAFAADISICWYIRFNKKLE